MGGTYEDLGGGRGVGGGGRPAMFMIVGRGTFVFFDTFMLPEIGVCQISVINLAPLFRARHNTEFEERASWRDDGSGLVHFSLLFFLNLFSLFSFFFFLFFFVVVVVVVVVGAISLFYSLKKKSDF